MSAAGDFTVAERQRAVDIARRLVSKEIAKMQSGTKGTITSETVVDSAFAVVDREFPANVHGATLAKPTSAKKRRSAQRVWFQPFGGISAKLQKCQGHSRTILWQIVAQAKRQRNQLACLLGSMTLLAEHIGIETWKKQCVLVKRAGVLARELAAKRAARGPK